MSTFWNDLVKRFGDRDDVVNIPGAPFMTNKYIDDLQKRVLAPYIDSFDQKVVLDVGSGIGRWTSRLAEKADRVIGIDISKEMVKIAKKRVRKCNVDFLVCAVYALPLRSGSVDDSLSVTCIQHIVDDVKQRESIQEIARASRDQVLILELMSSNSRKTRLFHYPTLILPKTQYVSTLKSAEIKSIRGFGVDFLPFVQGLEQIRNSLFKKINFCVPAYGGSINQQLLRSFYQIVSLLALLASLPFAKIFSSARDDLTRHVLLVARK